MDLQADEFAEAIGNILPSVVSIPIVLCKKLRFRFLEDPDGVRRHVPLKSCLKGGRHPTKSLC